MRWQDPRRRRMRLAIIPGDGEVLIVVEGDGNPIVFGLGVAEAREASIALAECANEEEEPS